MYNGNTAVHMYKCNYTACMCVVRIISSAYSNFITYEMQMMQHIGCTAAAWCSDLFTTKRATLRELFEERVASNLKCAHKHTHTCLTAAYV